MIDQIKPQPTMDDVSSHARAILMIVTSLIHEKNCISKQVVVSAENAARDVGYVQSQFAIGLRSEITPLTVVALRTLGNTVFTKALRCITASLAKQNLRPVFSASEYSEHQKEVLVRDLLSRPPSGILLADLERNIPTKQPILAANVPVAKTMDIDSTPISKAFGLTQKEVGKLLSNTKLRHSSNVGASAQNGPLP